MSGEADSIDLHAQAVAASANEKASQLRRLLETDDFKRLMSEQWGRRFMWRLLGLTGLFRNPFSGERGQTDFRCGEQNIGQQMLGEIHALCPERYHQMVLEQRDDGNRSDAEH